MLQFSGLFFPKNLPENGPILTFEARHILLSVGIAANVPDFEEGICFVTKGRENELIQKMLDYLEKVSDAAYQPMTNKFNYVFEALVTSQNVRKDNLTKEFESYCQELIVIGFNSSSYDLNLIKAVIVQQLFEQIEFVIKKANSYLCIKTKKLRFLDIKHYLASGFSYQKFLIVYCSDLQKFYFPNEFITDKEKLQSGMPEHQTFYSSLAKFNVTKEEYEFVKKTWIKKVCPL